MARSAAFGAAVLAAAFAPAVVAHAVTPPPQPGDTVPGHPGLTYLDLIKQAVPDLAENPDNHQLEGHLAGPLKHLAGKEYDGDPPDPVTVSYIEDLRFRAEGRPRIALMVDLGADPDRAYDTALLALFDDALHPKLLDAVDVGVDRDISFSDQAKLPLGPGDDALVTYSEHFNSSQTYAGRLLVFVRANRWRLIENLFTLSYRACGYESEEDPTWSTTVDKGRPYRRIDLVVRETLKHNDETDCDPAPPKPYVHAYRATWRWNTARQRFESTSTNLKRLDKANQARF